MKNIGFIGMGNMAQALAAGFLKSGLLSSEQIFAFAPDQEKLHRNAERIGFTPAGSAAALAAEVDTVIMACKPYQIEGVLSGLPDALNGKGIAIEQDAVKFCHGTTAPTNRLAAKFGFCIGRKRHK